MTDTTPPPATRGSVLAVLDEVLAERGTQELKWGHQDHPDGTGSHTSKTLATAARNACERAFEENRGTWRHILAEEFHEAISEEKPEHLRAELLQVAAVAVAWVQAIDKRVL